MSQAVGFNFQGDVFLGGSLVLSSTGRLLKALSDGGVDIYAVGAVIELGKRIPITQYQESVVSRSMQKRFNSRKGFLAKALSVGWGHNDAAYELSRTRAGCAALLTMNAFAAGTTTYIAAQGLQMMMSLSGCEAGFLPTVDAIQRVVKYMVPIMEDSGFHAVYGTITTGATTQLRKLHCGYPSTQNEHFLSLESQEPREWADAVHQLILTASLGESIYIYARCRAAWIAAFAVCILEMQCTILCQSDVLWAAAGSCGSVVIQIAFKSTQPPVEFARSFELLSTTVNDHVESTYLLKDALASELSQLTVLSSKSHLSIQYAIAWTISEMSKKVWFGFALSRKSVTISGPFGQVNKTIVSVCQSLGIELDDLESTVTQALALRPVPINPQPPGSKILEFLGADASIEIAQVCTCTNHTGSQDICLLRVVEGLILSVASTGLALIPCLYDSSTLRVNASLSKIWCNTRLARNLLSWCEETIPISSVFSHLHCLLVGGSNAREENSAGYVAVSGQSNTVAYRALLEEDAFSKEGKYLAIYPGLLSAEGCFREFVVDTGSDVSLLQNPVTKPWSLAEGTSFRPFDMQFFSPYEASCEVRVQEFTFEVRFQVSSQGSSTQLSIGQSRGPYHTNTYPPVLFSIIQAINAILCSGCAPSCGHPVDRPFVVPKPKVFTAIRAGFSGVSPAVSCCTFVSGHGNRLEQLISLFFANPPRQHSNGSWSWPYVLLQEDSCLSCAYEYASEEYQRPQNIYDSAVIICRSK